jgi:hypothetical protein
MSESLKLTDIARLRLSQQHIAGATFKTAKEIVGWMGALQAQEVAMAKWAIGARLPNATDSLIEAAIDKGEIIRMHLLRPTWHFVSADNVYWMLELTAPQIKASLRARHKQLELSEVIVTQSNALIEKALEQAGRLKREELVAKFKEAKIATEDNRASHLLLMAELEGLVCSGPTSGGKQTYALFEERVPKAARLSKEEALARLAKIYFLSHGPATLQDFVWWSSLPVGDARRALEMTKSEFTSETIASNTYWFDSSPFTRDMAEDTIHLLPAFDEFIISYQDRSAALPLESHRKAVSSNGVFWPVIVVDGQIVGIWKRSAKRDKLTVTIELFEPGLSIDRDQIEQAVLRYGNFLQEEAEVKFNRDPSGLGE